MIRFRIFRESIHENKWISERLRVNIILNIFSNSEKPAIIIQKHIVIKTNNRTLGNVPTIQIKVPTIQIDTAEKPWNIDELIAPYLLHSTVYTLQYIAIVISTRTRSTKIVNVLVQ